jgi:hypothetical protein
MPPSGYCDFAFALPMLVDSLPRTDTRTAHSRCVGLIVPSSNSLIQAVAELDRPPEPEPLQRQPVAALRRGRHDGPDAQPDLVDRALELVEGPLLDLPASDLRLDRLQVSRMLLT